MRSPLTHLLAEPRVERLARFNDDRETIAAITIRRVVDAKRRAARDPRGLEIAINEVCFLEEQRFRSGKLDDDDRALRPRLSHLRRNIRRLSEAELTDALSDLTRSYVDQIVGNFNPAVYAFASRAAPVLLSLLFSPVRLGRSVADLSQLRERVLIEGQIADIERLSRKGTLIVVPTHLSNVDSIAVGFALERTGLPPVTYGAGKNLFGNPLLAYFMENLGAYRVDRRIRHDLYKETLKTYAQVLLERGYHSLFFPGGTRSRSGAIEKKLKLGLLGAAVDAQVSILQKGGRPLYVVPATINYHLVLEAATLIDDYLKERGQHRYIIDDDESTQLARVAGYLGGMLRAEHSATIHFSEPMDVLGHRVSPDGTSHDDRGRPIELAPFFTRDGEIVPDAMRDAEYTRETGERVVRAFHADTHVLSTHLVAFALFRALARQTGSEELFRIIRGEVGAPAIPLLEVLASLDRLIAALRDLAARRQLRLGLQVAHGDARALLDEALRYFALFHTRPPARREGSTIVVEDRALCCYYHQRLTGFGLEPIA